MPVRCNGIQWISHKRKALKCLLDRYGTHCKWERFTDLNICGFGPMRFFIEILSWSLGQQCLLFKYS